MGEVESLCDPFFFVVLDNSPPVVYFPALPDKTGSVPRIPWGSSEEGQFECSLDDAAYVDCGSGIQGMWSGKDVPHGSHVFSVRGRDKNGNVGQPVKHTWNVGKLLLLLLLLLLRSIADA